MTTYTCGVCKAAVEVTNEDKAAVTHTYLGRRCPGSWIVAIATTYQADDDLVELADLDRTIEQLQAKLKRRCVELLSDYPASEIARHVRTERRTISRWEKESFA